MKTLVLTSLLIICARGQAAFAQTVPATAKGILPSVEMTVTRHLEQSDSGCQPAGSKVFEVLSAKTGSALSNQTILNELLAHNGTRKAALESDQSQCGASCQQVNLVSDLTTTVPNKTYEVASCSGRAPQIIEQDFANRKSLTAFVGKVLKAGNDIGKKLDAACPPPCSYDIGSAVTPGANGTQHLSLSVLCGPARSGSILFATYFYSAGLVQQWACKKP